MFATKLFMSYVLVFTAGFGLCVVTSESRKPSEPKKGSLRIGPGDSLTVYQSRSPQAGSFELRPFAVSDERHGRVELGQAPLNPDDLWLVSLNNGASVVSCSRVR